MAGSGFHVQVNGGLHVVLDLDLADIGFVAFEAEDQVVGAWGKGKSDGGLAGLLIAVDEDIGAGWASSDEEAFGNCFEQELLILRIAGLELERGLDLEIAFFLNLQAVACRNEIVEAAGRLAGASSSAGRTKD